VFTLRVFCLWLCCVCLFCVFAVLCVESVSIFGGVLSLFVVVGWICVILLGWFDLLLFVSYFDCGFCVVGVDCLLNFGLFWRF